MGTEAPPPIPGPGSVVAGRYRVEHVLGQGGMGRVVAAEHLSLRKRVAVKFLLPEALQRPEAVERFVREARAAAAIQNDHVARILDVGIQESGAPYIVMEYLTGRVLADVLRERGPLPAEEAVGYVLEACEALAEAHARGIVHRDLKPSNLFLASPTGGPPVVKLLDFGLAKSLPPGFEAEDSITTTNLVMGSVHYMSPEQMRSLKQADERSDIWSLGVILYELLCGHRPFQGDSLPASLLMIGLDPPPPLPAGTTPQGLESVILRCLEKNRDRRPQTVADLALLLAPFGPAGARASVDRIVQCRPPDGGTQTSATRRSPAPATTPQLDWTETHEPSAAHAAPAADAPPRRSPRPLLTWLAGAAALVATALLVRAWSRADQPSPSDIEADRLASFAPLPIDVVPTDPIERRRVDLGGRLFADPRLSKNGDIACTSCHPLDRYGVDGRKLSRGSDDREPPRNTLGIYNVAGFFALLWDGRKDDLVEQAKEVLVSPRAMAASADQLPIRLRGLPDYPAAFAQAFPEDAEPVSFENIARALAAFESTLYTRGRWDRFLEGDHTALTDEEKAGFNRFVDVGCVTCHFGPNVGATMFQKLGLVKAWPDSRDRGRFEITRRDVDWMVFRVPTLRNVEKTGPYFHDGSVTDLDTAIELMARHQLGKELDPIDVQLIRRWLSSLTGDIPRG